MGSGKSTTPAPTTTKKSGGRRKRNVDAKGSTTKKTTASSKSTSKAGSSKSTSKANQTTTPHNPPGPTGLTTTSGNMTNCPVGFLCIDVKGKGQCQACPKECPLVCFIKNNKPTC